MKIFNKIAIVGLGLIGGSLGRAIKERKIADEVIGISRKEKTLEIARRIGAIDRGSLNLEAVKDADLVIFATPVKTIIDLATPISLWLKPKCIVTDVGSTKKEIVSKLDKIFPHYVGSHPLAGSEKRGIMNATLDFRGSLCILTPTPNTSFRAAKFVKRFWRGLGAKVIFLHPALHDKILSLVSHLPHAVSFALMNAIPKSCLRFASAGLRDTTRLASSDSQLWVDIFLTNSKNMLKAIELFEENLSKIKSAIQQKDKIQLANILKKAKTKRDTL